MTFKSVTCVKGIAIPTVIFPFAEQRLVPNYTFSALTLLVEQQEGHPACKKLSDAILVWFKVQICIWLS